MKRLTFFGLTLLAMNSSLFAQPSNDKNIGIYVKGYSLKQKAEYAKFLGNGYESLLMYTLQPSLAFGVKGNFPLNSNFTLSPRIGYSQMDGLFNADSQLFRFYFLTSDFLLNYYFLKGENIFGRLYGGLRADCLINQTGGKKLSKVDYSGYSNFVLNYVGGIGLDFRKRIFLEFEYSGNINYFVKNRYMKVNYRTVSINLGCYLFRPGLKY